MKLRLENYFNAFSNHSGERFRYFRYIYYRTESTFYPHMITCDQEKNDFYYTKKAQSRFHIAEFFDIRSTYSTIYSAFCLIIFKYRITVE